MKLVLNFVELCLLLRSSFRYVEVSCDMSKKIGDEERLEVAKIAFESSLSLVNVLKVQL